MCVSGQLFSTSSYAFSISCIIIYYDTVDRKKAYDEVENNQPLMYTRIYKSKNHLYFCLLIAFCKMEFCFYLPEIVAWIKLNQLDHLLRPWLQLLQLNTLFSRDVTFRFHDKYNFNVWETLIFPLSIGRIQVNHKNQTTKSFLIYEIYIRSSNVHGTPYTY